MVIASVVSVVSVVCPAVQDPDFSRCQGTKLCLAHSACANRRIPRGPPL